MNTEKLFSYGTLQYENVQRELVGRNLVGKHDTLVGYEISHSIEITDSKIVEISGETTHRTLHYSGNTQHLIPGMIFDVSPEELKLIDVYEADYKRVLVTLKSGTQAWVYISRAEELKHIIEVVPYDSMWPAQFQSEAELIKPLYKDNFVAIYHIGSTAIPNLSAKPTIDILLEVKDIHKADEANAKMAKLGYHAWGEYGIPGRRFFVKGEEKRTHHVHAFQSGNPDIKKHINFRDYLIAHPEVAKEYEQLKIKLAEKFKNNRRAYVEGKQNFIDVIKKKAQGL